MAPEMQNRDQAQSGGKPGVSAPDPLPEVPQRGYFLLKEVCRITDTQPYVLRFWESEFPQLAGKKRGRQVSYTQDDIGLILQIKQLLHNEEYTLADARERLDQGAVDVPVEAVEEQAAPDTESLQDELDGLKERLTDIRGRYEGATREIAHLKAKLAGSEDYEQRYEEACEEIRDLKEGMSGRLQAIQQAFRKLTGFRAS
jgi:DNA-binding transcriptional MerR regulator